MRSILGGVRKIPASTDGLLMKKLLMSLKIAGMTAALLVAASPAAADPLLTDAGASYQQGGVSGGESVSFSVVGPWGLKVGDTFTEADFDRMGVPKDAIQPSVNSDNLQPEIGRPVSGGDSGSSDTDALQALAADPYVFQTWTERDGRTVYLWSDVNHKIVTVHNVTWQVARTTTKYPESKIFEGGTSYRYETPVNHVTCSGWLIFRKCKVTESVDVRTVVNFREHYGKTKGVVTTYCIGYSGFCPTWVREAGNV